MSWDCTFIILSGPGVPALTSPTRPRETDFVTILPLEEVSVLLKAETIAHLDHSSLWLNNDSNNALLQHELSKDVKYGEKAQEDDRTLNEIQV